MSHVNSFHTLHHISFHLLSFVVLTVTEYVVLFCIVVYLLSLAFLTSCDPSRTTPLSVAPPSGWCQWLTDVLSGRHAPVAGPRSHSRLAWSPQYSDRPLEWRDEIFSAVYHFVSYIIIIIIIIIKQKLKAQINRRNVTNAPQWRSYRKL